MKMPNNCAVVNCNSYKATGSSRPSLFKVPDDENLRLQWAKSIGVEHLRSDQRICENHFKKCDVIKEYTRYNEDGQPLTKVQRLRARLQKGAVPTIFDKAQSEIKSKQIVASQTIYYNNLDHTYAMQELVLPQDITDESKDSKHASIDKKDTIEHRNSTYVNLSNLQLLNNDEESHSKSDSLRAPEINITKCDKNNGEVQVLALGLTSVNPTKDNPILGAFPIEGLHVGTNNMVNSIKDSESTIALEDSTSESDESTNVFTHVTVQFDQLNFEFVTSQDDHFKTNTLLTIPQPWNVGQCKVKDEEALIFSYAVYINDSGKEKHIFEKSVIITSSREIIYEIYMTPVDVTQLRSKLPNHLSKISSLPEILKLFKDLKICKGITTSLLSVDNSNLKNVIDTHWRHVDCSLLSIKSDRCKFCKKYSNTLAQKHRRMKKRTTFKRISSCTNPLDRMRLKAMRKQLKSKTEKNKRLSKKVELLTKSISNCQDKIAALNNTVLEKVSKNQQLIIEQIISAAKLKNPRGRRYSDEFIMLCMLMNIRSSGYYEFLRKNDIIPLPCTRTIRDYISLIDTKCGFDEKFFILLKKAFDKKKPSNRHGIITLDEINLRKAVAVNSRTLTYVGLTDYGDEGPKGSDVDDLATHGLVLQYQSLTEKYTQPIAVFASKNSVHGEELAKIVLKAICLLENAGARIHAVLGDGARTNTKMWKCLGITSSVDKVENWFHHPLDDERKIFIFSDSPHLIKCIRNKLYDAGQLRMSANKGYIRWKYFVDLFNIDSNQPGNARVRHKITRRHVILDNAGKMRVKFATQIFSNSVAVGLRFYSAHYGKEFEGCKETIDFCLKINNLYDALNRKQPNQGLTPESKDYKVLKESLQWLNEWEKEVKNGHIPAHEFLTKDTANGLRLTIQSTLDLCKYLIDKYNFKYLLTGKVNQDNLEKFFGTIRGAAGTNDHPTCPTFLLLYKLLSVYSVLSPPIYGNCTVNEKQFTNVITISELKEIYGKPKSKTAEVNKQLKERLDNIIEYEDWEVDEVIEHDYALPMVVDCIIYYVTGYLIKQILKNDTYKHCSTYVKALSYNKTKSSITELVDLKTKGHLIHANKHFFNLIQYTETQFSKHASNSKVFDIVVDEVLDNYHFTFPCHVHGADLLSYALYYYLRLRMRQYTYQTNQNVKKKYIVHKKLAKFYKE